MGWICGEDIDVTVDEGNEKAADVQEEDEVPLEVQLGKGETTDSCQFISFNRGRISYHVLQLSMLDGPGYLTGSPVSSRALARQIFRSLSKVTQDMYYKINNTICRKMLVTPSRTLSICVVNYLYQAKFFFCTALQKAGKHMEDSVVAAYVALLLGCILQENEVRV